MVSCDFDRELLTAAQAVDVTRLRLPSEAGVIDPTALLPPEQAGAFASFAARVSTQQPSDLPRPCFLVPRASEQALRRRLLDTGMVVAVPESELAELPGGGPLLNGLFAVPHPKGQRTILIADPQTRGRSASPGPGFRQGLCWPGCGSHGPRRCEDPATILKTFSISSGRRNR